jgi:hypothetical protein
VTSADCNPYQPSCTAAQRSQASVTAHATPPADSRTITIDTFSASLLPLVHSPTLTCIRQPILHLCHGSTCTNQPITPHQPPLFSLLHPTHLLSDVPHNRQSYTMFLLLVQTPHNNILNQTVGIAASHLTTSIQVDLHHHRALGHARLLPIAQCTAINEVNRDLVHLDDHNPIVQRRSMMQVHRLVWALEQRHLRCQADHLVVR